tara:strand:- start:64 stop:888 length:825 start_codon:yes stop_codon:yes gene_type:complete
MATPKWLQDVMKQSSTAAGRAKSRANAPTKQEMKQANEMAKTWLTNIGLTMIPVGLVGTKVGQALAKGYGKAISSGITNTLQRGGSKAITPKFVKSSGTLSAGEIASFVRYMTPKQFMSLVPKLYRRSKAKRLINKMKKGKEIDMPELWVNIDKGGALKVSAHEGRHRTQVANLLQGNKEIPVKIWFGPRGHKEIIPALYKRKIRDKTGKKILNPNRYKELDETNVRVGSLGDWDIKSAAKILPKGYRDKVTIYGEKGSAAERFKRRFKKNLKV